MSGMTDSVDKVAVMEIIILVSVGRPPGISGEEV